MRALPAALASVFLLLLCPRPAHGSDVLTAIDEAYRAGRIDTSQRHVYRVAAVKAPDRLPAELRKRLRTDALTERSNTTVLVEAYQALPTLTPPAAAEVRDLLMPPPDLEHSIETTTPYPIRVSFAAPSQQAKAERVLQAAITSYEREVQDWGFWEPPIEEGAQFYRYYIMDAGGAAGYTSPYLDVTSTPRADAFSYIVIDPSLDTMNLDATVAHEFNHACQVSMDVAEMTSFMENTASYIEVEVFPSTWPLTQQIFSWFQSQPYRPLEYKLGFDTDGYEYGGALWVLFLTYQYGDGDPAWLRRVWEGSVQNSYENEPDYFDALEELLPAEVGVAGAAATFSQHRFFVGKDDDGQHLPNAGNWRGSEVWRTATWNEAQLPIVDQGPTSSSTQPQPNGCNYVVLNLDGSSELPFRVSFDGQASAAWAVSVMTAAAGQTTTHDELPIDEAGTGELVVAANGSERLVLAMCQSMSESYDPDERQWGAADYRYSIQYDIPAPTVTGASPATIEQGAHDVVLTLTGTGFVDHPDLAVSVSGLKVIAELDEFVSSEELKVKLIAAPTAELGPRDILVINPGGAVGTGPELITIVAPVATDGTDDLEPPDESGCACRVGPRRSAPSQAANLLFAALLGGTLARRRRSAHTSMKRP